MKLRIKGNSIRVRVMQSELARLGEVGVVEDAIEFGPGVGQRLSYALRRSPATGDLVVKYSEGRIEVLIPVGVVERWRATNQVGLRGEQDLGGGRSLAILVEKDFACLDAGREEENVDAFPNPGTPAGGAKC